MAHSTDMDNFSGDVLKLLFDNKLLDDIVNQVLDNTISIALILAGSFYILTFGWNYMKTGFDRLTTSKPGPPLDIQQLARSIVLVLFIISYKPIVNMADSYIYYINTIGSPTQEQMDDMGENASKFQEKTKDSKALLTADQRKTSEEAMALKQAQDDSSFWDYVTDPILIVQMGIFGIIKFFTYILKGIIGGIAIFMYKFMIVVGPLAAAFSILPFQSSKLEEWANATLGAAFVYMTFNILDHFQYFIWEVMVAMPGLEDAEGSSFIQITSFINVIILVLYTMAFSLTSKFVGKADAGRAASKVMALAVTAVAAAGGAALGAAGAGGGAAGSGGGAKGIASNVMGAAEKSKDVFKDEE